MGIMTDSRNVMKSNKKDIFKHLKDMILTLLDLGWYSLHHVMNAIDFANDVYYYFDNIGTYRADYKEMQKEEKLPPYDKSNNFLHPVAASLAT